MKHLIFTLGLVFTIGSQANESSVTVPWQEFDSIYKEQIQQELKSTEISEPEPLITLENIQYDLNVQGEQITGTVAIAGSVLVGDPEPLSLFGENLAVTNILEVSNAVLLANEGRYYLYTYDAGVFLVRFEISIPIADFQVKPRLEFEVPTAVRNELRIKFDERLKLLQSDVLHKVGDSYFFSPRTLLTVGFEHVGESIEGVLSEDSLLSKVDTPEAVLHSVTFYSSFAEDGTVLSAMHLVIPGNERNQLELNPIEGAEVWSLTVNDKPRSLYLSAAEKWVIPLDPKVDSKIELAYLTRNQKLGLEGRLDFEIPETGLTARSVNLIVGLPERMHMLAMDSDLQPANGRGWPEFKSFNGRPHFFSRPFYRGRAFSASIIYQEPVNP